MIGRGVAVERLRVGVDGDELDAFEAEVDHRVDGVAAGAADTDDLDARLYCVRSSANSIEKLIVLLPVLAVLNRCSRFAEGCLFPVAYRCSRPSFP